MFSIKAVQLWNRFLKAIVGSPSLEVFKERLYNYLSVMSYVILYGAGD